MGDQSTESENEVCEEGLGLFLDGYAYHKSNTNKKTATVYYKCLNYEKHKCPGRAIKHQGRKAFMSQSHNEEVCERRPEYAKRRQFHIDLMRACSSAGNRSTSLTYSDLAKQNVRGAELTPLKSQKRSAARHRRNATRHYQNIGKIANAKTIKDLGEILTAEESSLSYLYGEESHAIETKIFAADDKWHILWFDEDFVQKFALTNMYVDATFDVRPHNLALSKRKSQFLTIMAETAIGKVVPIAFALMSNRTVETYRALFQTLKSTFPGLLPNKIMSDYEEALRSAFRLEFPNAQILGCWFHFAQAVYKNAAKYNMVLSKKQKQENPVKHKLIKKLIAIALLPDVKIIEGFKLVEEECLEKFPNDPQIINFIKYYQNQWLPASRQVSVYRQSTRTNNVVESYHRNIKRQLNKKPNLSNFLCGLLEIMRTARLHFNQAQIFELQDLKYSKTSFGLTNEQIALAWDHLDGIRDVWTISRFLDEMSYFDEQISDCSGTSSLDMEVENECMAASERSNIASTDDGTTEEKSLSQEPMPSTATEESCETKTGDVESALPAEESEAGESQETTTYLYQDSTIQFYVVNAEGQLIQLSSQ